MLRFCELPGEIRTHHKLPQRQVSFQLLAVFSSSWIRSCLFSVFPPPVIEPGGPEQMFTDSHLHSLCNRATFKSHFWVQELPILQTKAAFAWISATQGTLVIYVNSTCLL